MLSTTAHQREGSGAAMARPETMPRTDISRRLSAASGRAADAGVHSVGTAWLGRVDSTGASR